MQVWFNDRLVGEFHTSIPPSGEFLRIPILDSAVLACDGFAPSSASLPLTRELSIPIAVMGASMERRDIEDGREVLFRHKHGIPDDAQKNVCMEDLSYRFRWRALRPDAEQYQELFDMDQFVPE